MSYSLAFSQSLFMMLYVADKIDQGIFDFIATQQISEDLNIPTSTASMILRRLNRAGLIETREGAGGGVRLAIQPDEITVLDIFNAIEQGRPLFQTNIRLRVTGDKPTRAQQGILKVLEEAEGAMKRNLETTTIKDLMDAVNS